MTDGIGKLEDFYSGRNVLEYCFGEPLPDAKVGFGLEVPHPPAV